MTNRASQMIAALTIVVQMLAPGATEQALVRATGPAETVAAAIVTN